jgi:hypothetical protein
MFTDVQLKSLLNYLFENISGGNCLDEAALRGFSLDILKKKMPEFEKLALPEDMFQSEKMKDRPEYMRYYYGDSNTEEFKSKGTN